jgi:hypothetical protein
MKPVIVRKGSGPRHLLGIDVKKTVEGSSIETVKTSREWLFRAKARPGVVWCWMGA